MSHNPYLLWFLCGVAAAGCATSGGRPARPAVVDKPLIVAAADWGSKAQPIPDARAHTPKFITIHHAGTLWTGKTTPEVFVRNMQAWGQREKKWPDLPYHFLIAPDGTIYEGRSLRYEPESNTQYALQGHVGVELMGNFEQQRMSPEQLDSLVRLVAWLGHTLDIPTSDIAGHNDRVNGQTVCPGRDLYRYIEDGSIQKWAAALREGHRPEIVYRDPLPNGPTTRIARTAPDTRPAR